jgi:uncharacterized membrane protein
MNNKKLVRYLCEAAVIAALYTVLTYIAAAWNLAYGSVQFRFSEALTILPIFTPAAIPGLTLGCFLSNLGSTLGIVDWVFGTLATFLAAVTGRMLRKIEIANVPVLSILMPVLFNAVIVGFELICLSDSGSFAFTNANMSIFIPTALSVGIGELVVLVVLGIPLTLAIKKNHALEKIFSGGNA